MSTQSSPTPLPTATLSPPPTAPTPTAPTAPTPPTPPVSESDLILLLRDCWSSACRLADPGTAETVRTNHIPTRYKNLARAVGIVMGSVNFVVNGPGTVIDAQSTNDEFLLAEQEILQSSLHTMLVDNFELLLERNYEKVCSRIEDCKHELFERLDLLGGLLRAENAENQMCRSWINGQCNQPLCNYLHQLSLGVYSFFMELRGHERDVTGLVFHGGKVFSASEEGKMNEWSSNGALASSGVCGRPIGAMAIWDDWLYAGAADGVIAMKIDTDVRIFLEGGQGTIYCLAAGEDMIYAGSGTGHSGHILGWKYHGGNFVSIGFVQAHSSPIITLVGGSQGLLYSGSADGNLKVWDPLSLQCVRSLDMHKAAVSAIICYNETVLTFSFDGSLKVWDEIQLKVLKSVTTSHKLLSAVAHIDADTCTCHILVACSDGFVRVYEFPSMQEIGWLFCGTGVRRIASCPGWILTGDSSGAIKVWKGPDQLSQRWWPWPDWSRG